MVNPQRSVHGNTGAFWSFFFLQLMDQIYLCSQVTPLRSPCFFFNRVLILQNDNYLNTCVFIIQQL